MLKSNIYDYHDAYILVKGDNVTMGRNVAQVAFKNCAPFTKCIAKIYGTTIDDVEDLDMVMPMHNLLELQAVYDFVLKMKQLNLMLILRTMMPLSLSSITLNYWETQSQMEQMNSQERQHFLCY